MKTWSFYDPLTGLFAGLEYSGDEETVEANTPEGHAAAEGRHDHLSRRMNVATGEVEDYQPPAPSADHEWNATTKRWQLGALAQAMHDGRQSALAQIVALEARQPRAIREAFLGYDGAVARMKDMDAQIVELRKVLS